MKLYVHMSPADVAAIQPPIEDVYIVIDVVRATTAMTTMFDRGARRVLAADTVEQARQSAQRTPGRLLCGERHALPLPGFDYGNSPAEFAQLDLRQRELILTTTNGSRAFFACPTQSIRLAGCFYNAAAVTAAAIQQAERQKSNIQIVCAAENGYFALDDTVCAGYLVREIQRQLPALQCHESASTASELYQLYPPARLAACSHSIQQVVEAGLSRDIEICLQQSGSNSIGQVIRQEPETGLLILEPFTDKV
ncbi:2-phosphosulfolactate phosphatase [Dictyobacter arantiisoli]|uniref:Probable 2-phosphosulfolactate phosphatase n=1 Tax=Dictyobacter arantiisoli TaxID=2014874 RepID=A0A5A5TEM6_9CHLR|nr:2-phosphosulfolactate phosphatase [Dictyobacter arantiisoli]GCF09698.1 putative 2-phosphosulfolactate phosphatase [Dictyobacter arantiisoli]